MKMEEAVEVLKERYLTCVGIGLDNHANRVNEAIDMAIEALQRENAEVNGYCHRIKPKGGDTK